MTEEDAGRVGAQRSCRLHVVALAQAQDEAADDARVANPGADGQHDDENGNAGAGDRDHRDGQQHERKRELDVDQLRDDAIDAAAVVAADEADQRAHDGAQHGGGERDQQRDSSAPDETREQVPPEQIGAEKTRAAAARDPRRRPEPRSQVAGRRRGRRHPGRQQRSGDGDDHGQRREQQRPAQSPHAVSSVRMRGSRTP